MAHVQTKCPNCHRFFDCNPQGHCWCVDRPHGPMPTTATACLCPSCLKASIESFQILLDETGNPMALRPRQLTNKAPRS